MTNSLTDATRELLEERTISLAAAARMLPPGRRGRPVTISCVLRWVIDGVKTPAGVVRLQAVRVGSRWVTSVEALERFADRQTPQFENVQHEAPRTGTARQRAAERAFQQLRKLGI
jgi:hypothetical protein